MRESEIENILMREVRKAGGYAYKFISPGNDGVPDRIIVKPGRPVLFVELKTKRGRMSRVQNAQINRLRRLGADVRIVRGLEGLAALFADLDMPEALMRVNGLLARGEV